MNSNFVALCYHYIRKDINDPFPRLLGTKINDFSNHVEMRITKPNKDLKTESSHSCCKYLLFNG